MKPSFDPQTQPEYPDINWDHPLSKGLWLATAFTEVGSRTLVNAANPIPSQNMTLVGTSNKVTGQGYFSDGTNSSDRIVCPFMPNYASAAFSIAMIFTAKQFTAKHYLAAAEGSGVGFTFRIGDGAPGDYPEGLGINATTVHITPSKRHALVGTVDPGKGISYLYLDNLLLGTYPAGVFNPSQVNPVWIGNDNADATRTWNGWIHSTYMWLNRTLTQAEVAWISTEPFAPFYPYDEPIAYKAPPALPRILFPIMGSNNDFDFQRAYDE